MHQTIDLANHPQHGNLLYRRQADVARVLGIPRSLFCHLYCAQFPHRRWPSRQYASMLRKMQRIYAEHQRGWITRETAAFHMNCLGAEMNDLVRGPAPILVYVSDENITPIV